MQTSLSILQDLSTGMLASAEVITEQSSLAPIFLWGNGILVIVYFPRVQRKPKLMFIY